MGTTEISRLPQLAITVIALLVALLLIWYSCEQFKIRNKFQSFNCKQKRFFCYSLSIIVIEAIVYIGYTEQNAPIFPLTMILVLTLTSLAFITKLFSLSIKYMEKYDITIPIILGATQVGIAMTIAGDSNMPPEFRILMNIITLLLPAFAVAELDKSRKEKEEELEKSCATDNATQTDNGNGNTNQPANEQQNSDKQNEQKQPK